MWEFWLGLWDWTEGTGISPVSLVVFQRHIHLEELLEWTARLLRSQLRLHLDGPLFDSEFWESGRINVFQAEYLLHQTCFGAVNTVITCWSVPGFRRWSLHFFNLVLHPACGRIWWRGEGGRAAWGVEGTCTKQHLVEREDRKYGTVGLVEQRLLVARSVRQSLSHKTALLLFNQQGASCCHVPVNWTLFCQQNNLTPALQRKYRLYSFLLPVPQSSPHSQYRPSKLPLSIMAWLSMRLP